MQPQTIFVPTGEGTGRGYYINPLAAQEVVIDTGSLGSAQYEYGGAQVNMIPKDGGNLFSGSLFFGGTGSALQGGNLGQSIGRGLQGWAGGDQRDTAEQGQRAVLQYVGEQQDMDPGLKSALMQNPALAMHYLQTRIRPRVTSDIAHYEYARKQGFGGTLADFIRNKHSGVGMPQP